MENHGFDIVLETDLIIKYPRGSGLIDYTKVINPIHFQFMETTKL